MTRLVFVAALVEWHAPREAVWQVVAGTGPRRTPGALQIQHQTQPFCNLLVTYSRHPWLLLPRRCHSSCYLRPHGRRLAWSSQPRHAAQCSASRQVRSAGSASTHTSPPRPSADASTPSWAVTGIAESSAAGSPATHASSSTPRAGACLLHRRMGAYPVSPRKLTSAWPLHSHLAERHTPHPGSSLRGPAAETTFQESR